MVDITRDTQFASIAFPAINCGIYRFPADNAVCIAVATVLNTLPRTQHMKHVTFACFDDAMFARYVAELERRRQAPPSNPA